MTLFLPFKKIFICLLACGLLITIFSGAGLRAAEEKGLVTGQVFLTGEPPDNPEVPVKMNADFCGKTFVSDEFVYNQGNNGVQNVLISLKSKNGPPASPRFGVSRSLSGKNCRFVPPVMGLQPGQFLTIENSDPVLHVLQFNKDNQFLYNIPLPAGGKKITRKFDEPGLVRVKCTLHPFMKGSIKVLDTPLFTLTNRDGSFQLSEIPPGKYILSVWHAYLKPVETEIESVPGGKLTFSFKLEKN